MALAASTPDRIDRIVGPLPPPGQLPADMAYPFATVAPVRDGYVEREGIARAARTISHILSNRGAARRLGG